MAGTPATAAEIEANLRRGRYLEVIEGGRALLATEPSAPVNGMLAVAAASTDDMAEATVRIRAAQQKRELNAQLHAFQVEALQHRSGRRLEAAAQACNQALVSAPGHPLNHLIMAQISFDSKKLEPAATAALAAINLEPQLAHAHSILGMVRQTQGRLGDALVAFAKAVELDESNLRPKIGLAETYLRLRAWTRAIDLCREILAVKPDFTNAHDMLIAALLEAGRAAEAVGEARKVLATRPGAAAASYALSRALAQQGDFAGAVTQLRHFLSLKTNSPDGPYLLGLFQLAQDEFSAARISLQSALAGGQKVTVLSALGVVEHLVGNLRGAADYFGQAAAQAGPEMKDRIQFMLANLKFSEKNWAAAKQHLAQATGFFPAARIETLDFPRYFQHTAANAPALVNLAVLFMADGLPDRAVLAYRDSLDKAPENVIALFLASTAFSRKLKYDEALETLKQATRTAPGYSPAYFAMGEIHHARKSPLEAIAAYTKTIEVDGDFGLAYQRLGVLHQLHREEKAAETMYRQAVRLLPYSPLAYNELAYILAEREQSLPEALALAQKAVELSPKNGSFLDTLGWVYFKSGAFPKAVETLEGALQASLDPVQIPLVRYHLGLAYARTGASAKALSEFETVLRLAPAFAHAEEVRKRVQELQRP